MSVGSAPTPAIGRTPATVNCSVRFEMPPPSSQTSKVIDRVSPDLGWSVSAVHALSQIVCPSARVADGPAGGTGPRIEAG